MIKFLSRVMESVLSVLLYRVWIRWRDHERAVLCDGGMEGSRPMKEYIVMTIRGQRSVQAESYKLIARADGYRADFYDEQGKLVDSVDGITCVDLAGLAEGE